MPNSYGFPSRRDYIAGICSAHGRPDLVDAFLRLGLDGPDVEAAFESGNLPGAAKDPDFAMTATPTPKVEKLARLRASVEKLSEAYWQKKGRRRG